MNRKLAFAALGCIATAVFAANAVNPTFLWDGSTDTEGRVITGSPEETSGYWFTYNDANDNGTSFLQFPQDFDLDTYDSYPFGLMAEEYGGIKLWVVLDDGYEYPYAGLGFNIWNEDQDGANITAWGGICLEYSSDLDFSVVLGIEDQKNILAYSGDIEKKVGKSNSLTVVDIPWEQFYGLFGGKTALTQAAAIKLKFQEEASNKTKGNFFLRKIGSLGQCKSDPVIPPRNDELRKVNPAFLWDASTDTEGRVITGSPEWTSGWWYDVYDHNDGGNSYITYPADCELNTYYNIPYAPMFEGYGGFTVTVELGEVIELREGYLDPYAGVAFNIWNLEDNGDGYGVDISEWGGFCLEYSSEVDFYVEIGVEDERTVTEYNNFKAPIKSSSDTVLVEVPWAKFAQELGWGKQADMDSVLAHAAIVRVKFQGEAGTKGKFFMSKLGSLGTCDGSFAAIRPAVNSQVNVSLSGRTVNFEGVVPSAKVSVMDLQGHIVKSATAASAMDLSSLPVGIYMLRVQGSNVH
ncbi:MAG: T9SS type A sorting domain-containing protein, partial [Fibrobacter sp.]|uniref:T9SS type A sorting domain-containing protein n=1 Tax=Fibrobacter sp. TaxID=35828 RepID=UPI0025C32BE2